MVYFKRVEFWHRTGDERESYSLSFVDGLNRATAPRLMVGVTEVEPMRVVSWNVNGIRACVRRGFVDFLDRSGADILGVQEVRALPEEIPPAARTPTDWHAAFTRIEVGLPQTGSRSQKWPMRVSSCCGPFCGGSICSPERSRRIERHRDRL